ncbi:MAG TPA: sugar phosphate isomerase/epimerase [Chloroflexota bacterium]|nr:sugar phosphate isomerase/epimerase [Chloroflexota bacterium]
MQIGCSTILYGGYPLDVALDGIRRAGYAAIELCAIPGMADHLPADATPAAYAAIRRQVADAGLAIESIGASTNLLDPDRRARFTRLIKAAAQLGAPALTTGSGGSSDDEASYQQVLATLKELAHVAEGEGVKISIKPHVRAAVYSTPTALRFVQDLPGDTIGLNYDASHLWRANETPEDSLAKLGGHLATARIRDAVSREPGGPGPVDEQIPGNGAMNVEAIARGLAILPQVSYTVLEIVGAKNLPLDDVHRVVTTSADRLKSLFASA